MCIALSLSPSPASSSEKIDVLSQLLNNVKLSTTKTDPDFLAKIGIVSGQALSMVSSSRNNDVHWVISFINDCYLTALKSGQMRNITACYIADYEAADLIQRQMLRDEPDKSLSDIFTSASDSKLVGILKQRGVANNKVLNEIQSEVGAMRLKASQWKSTLTKEQILECIDNGVGSQKCK